MMKNIAVFVSGGGTNLQTLIDAEKQNGFNGKIKLVLSSKPNVFALERAKKANIQTAVVSKKDFETDEQFDNAILAELKKQKIDFIVLAGYLSIVGKDVIRTYENRIINIHPSLIPSFCGMGYYGLKVHEAVVSYGVKISGATVHFVNEKADEGAIIIQEAVPVFAEDTAETLQKKVLEIEHKILPKAVELFCDDKLEVFGRIVKIK